MEGFLRSFAINVCRRTVGTWNMTIRTRPMSTSQRTVKRWEMFPARKIPMLPKDTFVGTVAFVTGGGTGLGAGIAGMLAQLGAHVTLASRNIDVLQKTADELSAKTNSKVIAVKCDVRDPHSVRDAVSQCIDKLGQLPTVVVNNAAGNFVCPSERLSVNAWKTVIDIVLMGTINVTMDVGKRLIAAGYNGVFLNISTSYARSGSGYVVPSACAKAGVEALTKSLSSEWSVHGLRFNCIAPGPIYTKGAFDRLDPSGTFRNVVKARIPTGRLGEIAELSNLACYLVSDYSNWMTGSVVQFDGGEYNFMAGEFNELEKVPTEEWNMIQNVVKRQKFSES